MFSPPNYGAGEINIFRGNLDSAHAEKTRGGDSFSQVVCNGVMLAFLVTVVLMSSHCCGFVRGLGGGLVWIDACCSKRIENYEDYRSGYKLKSPSIVRHQSYDYRDRFRRLIEEMAVTMTNGGHIDKWRLPFKMAVTLTDSID